jgi:hypothetical protein
VVNEIGSKDWLCPLFRAQNDLFMLFIHLGAFPLGASKMAAMNTRTHAATSGYLVASSSNLRSCLGSGGDQQTVPILLYNPFVACGLLLRQAHLRHT